MEQLKLNIDSIHEKDPRVWYYYSVTEQAHIALVTNCNVPLIIAQGLSVIVPVHEDDVGKKEAMEYSNAL